jgi:hypothetical protein
METVVVSQMYIFRPSAEKQMSLEAPDCPTIEKVWVNAAVETFQAVESVNSYTLSPADPTMNIFVPSSEKARPCGVPSVDVNRKL